MKGGRVGDVAVTVDGKFFSISTAKSQGPWLLLTVWKIYFYELKVMSMTSKKKTILERDQRFFVAAFFQKWIKTMLIRSAIFVWITLKYVTESTDKLLSLHLIVTLVSRAFQDCLEFDCYVIISQVSRLLFHSIVKWVSGTRLGLSHTTIVTLIFRTFYASFISLLLKYLALF